MSIFEEYGAFKQYFNNILYIEEDYARRVTLHRRYVLYWVPV